MAFRKFWTFVALWSACLAVAPSAFAASYPENPIHLIVPYPPGGTADVLGRILGQQLGKALGQPVVVENRAGAGTAIGSKFVAQSAADGYTLLIGTVSSQAINPALMPNIGYDPVGDFTAIAPLATTPFVLLIHPKVPAQDLQELITLAKRDPGKFNFASAGNGTSNHLAGILLGSLADIQLAHIPYKGSAPALMGLLAGQVDLMFDLIVTAVPHVEAKAVRPLAITDGHRSPLLPNVPTAAEAGLPGLELSAWFGLFAPRDLPPAIADRLSREVDRISRTSDYAEALRKLGAVSMSTGDGRFGAFVAAERDRWSQLIKTFVIQPN